MSPAWHLVLVAAVVSAQPHNDRDRGVDCYGCQDIPCSLRKTCAVGEVCQVNYGRTHRTMDCRRADTCEGGVAAAGARACSAGGTMVGSTCQICCANSSCVEMAIDLINNLHIASPTSPVIDYSHISCEELAGQGCAVMDAVCPYVNCTDVCQTCFKPIVAVPTTASPGTNSGAGIDYSHISCEELAGQGCAVMDAVCPYVNCSDVCQTCFKPIVTVPTTASPETGNSAGIDYSHISCEELAGQGCAVMDAVCPYVNCTDVCQTCFKPIVTVPTTASPETGNSAGIDYSHISCEELAGQGCAVMDAVCPYVNCTDVCQTCFKPIVTVPTIKASGNGGTNSGAGIDYSHISCEELAGQGCAVMDAVCPYVNCTDVCQTCFSPIVTASSASRVPLT